MPDIIWRDILNWRSPWGPFPQSSGNSSEQGVERLYESEGLRTPGAHGPLSQLSRALMGSQRLKQQVWGLQGSVPGPLHICCCCYPGVSGGLLTGGAGVSLTFLPVHGSLFCLLGHLVQHWFKALPCLTVFVLSCLVDIS